MVPLITYYKECILCDILSDICTQSYPILSTKQHNKVPEELGRVPVQKIIVTSALQCFVLGELYDIHLMSLLPNGQNTTAGTC